MTRSHPQGRQSWVYSSRSMKTPLRPIDLRRGQKLSACVGVNAQEVSYLVGPRSGMPSEFNLGIS